MRLFGKTEYVWIDGIEYKKYTPPWIKGPRPISTYTPLTWKDTH